MKKSLPEGWTEAAISEIADLIGGSTPPKADPSYWTNGDLPWVSPKDMKVFSLSSSEDTVTAKALDRLTLIPAGSVLIVVRSGILSRTLPVALSGIAVTINQDMRALVPLSGMSGRFIAWQLIAKEQEVLAASSKDGTTVASIEGPAFARFRITVAPLDEQHRVVEKIEELLSDLDAGIAELKAAQKKLDLYRQSLLKSAVEGALTAAWREQRRAGRAQQGEPLETGEQLLARILAERRARWEANQLAAFERQGKSPPKNWRDKYLEPVGPDPKDLGTQPQGWVWTTINQLARVGTGLTPLRSRGEYFAGGSIPWITSGALNNEAINEATEFVTNQAVQECRLEIYPAGSLLIAMYGEGRTRGKCSELLIDATINQAIAALTLAPSALACKGYLKAFLLHSYEAMREQASGGVQPNLNLQIIKAISLPLPPLDEQAEITRLLEENFEQIKQQQRAIDLGLRQAAAQRKNILKAAFSGQLVPQDSNDEPASVLLDCIRAERATQQAGAGKRRRKTAEAA